MTINIFTKFALLVVVFAAGWYLGSQNIIDQEGSMSINNEEMGSIEQDYQQDLQQSMESLSTKELLLGVWDSTEDKEVSLHITNESIIDMYANEEIGRADSWQVVTAAQAEEQGIQGVYDSSLEYLLIEQDQDVSPYAIVELDSESLLLNYLPRGNMLEFKREL